MEINGTLIWYYNICEREVWLMSHYILPDQGNENIDLGKFLHEQTYQRKAKEIEFGNVRFDVLLEKKDSIVIGETKKSSRFSAASRWQLLYYLSVLRKVGIQASGVLLYPSEKKREEVELTDTALQELEEMEKRILEIIDGNAPPPEKCQYCGKCGYNEYCWTDGGDLE